MAFFPNNPFSEIFMKTNQTSLLEVIADYAPVEKRFWLSAIQERLSGIPLKYCEIGNLTGVGFTFQMSYSLGQRKHCLEDMQDCAAAFQKNSEYQDYGCLLGTANDFPQKGYHQLYLFIPDTISAERVSHLFYQLFSTYMHYSGHDSEVNLPSDENLHWRAEIENNVSEDFNVQFAKYNQSEGAVLNLGCNKNLETALEADEKIQKIKEQIDQEMGIGGVVSIADTSDEGKDVVHVFIPMSFNAQEAANLFSCAYRIAKEIIENGE